MHSGRSDLLLNKNKTRESEFSLRTMPIRRSILGQHVELVEHRYLDVHTDNYLKQKTNKEPLHTKGAEQPLFCGKSGDPVMCSKIIEMFFPSVQMSTVLRSAGDTRNDE